MNRISITQTPNPSSVPGRTKVDFMDIALLDSLNDGITVLDAKGVVLFLNHAAEKQYGQDREQMIGRSITMQFADIKEGRQFLELLGKCFQGASIPAGDFTFALLNHKPWRFHLKTSLKVDPNSGTRILVLIHKDISHEKRLEEELENSEERLQSFVGHSPDIVLNIDEKGSILSFNQESRLKGIVGKSIFDFTLPVDHSNVAKEIQKVFSSGKERTYDVNGIGMDGVVRWYTTRILPVKHDDEVIAVTLNARDSSQVKGAETELKNHYRMLDSVFRAIPGTLLVLNRKLNIITSNHNGFEGLNQGTTGRFLKCYELIWKRNDSCEECLAKRVFRTGEPLLEKHYCQESHKTREIRMFPVMNEVAKVRYVVVHLQDLESGVKDEKQEQMIEMKAKAAMHLKTEFLSKINHELKTPMIGILGFSKLGQERYKKLGREKIKSYFKTIQESGERLQMRLNNLLDLSQLEPGSEAYDFQTETLSMVTTIVLNELFNQIEEKRIKVDFIKPDFPDLVQMDVDKIGKVIRNLISSAVKVSKPDRSIKIKITKKAEQCQFAISDSGKRLSKAELEELFKAPVGEISNQEGSSERGMGLAIAKKIIGDHDGRIWAESPRRGGLTFKFALPCSG